MAEFDRLAQEHPLLAGNGNMALEFPLVVDLSNMALDIPWWQNQLKYFGRAPCCKI